MSVGGSRRGTHEALERGLTDRDRRRASDGSVEHHPLQAERLDKLGNSRLGHPSSRRSGDRSPGDSKRCRRIVLIGIGKPSAMVGRRGTIDEHYWLGFHSFKKASLQIHREWRTSFIHSTKFIKGLFLCTRDHAEDLFYLGAFIQGMSSAWIFLSALSAQPLPIIHTQLKCPFPMETLLDPKLGLPDPGTTSYSTF